MYLADPKAKMIFLADTFGDRPRMGLTGGKLYAVSKARLPKLRAGGYAIHHLEWIHPDQDLNAEGRLFSVEVTSLPGERPGVRRLTDDNGWSLWMTSGGGRAVVFAVTQANNNG